MFGDTLRRIESQVAACEAEIQHLRSLNLMSAGFLGVAFSKIL